MNKTQKLIKEVHNSHFDCLLRIAKSTQHLKEAIEEVKDIETRTQMLWHISHLERKICNHAVNLKERGLELMNNV